MKKIPALLLALTLLCLCPALAFADNLYDTYGPMENWDDEIWELSAEWSDEQWDEYWQSAEEASLVEQAQEQRAARIKLGCPYPDGANVKLNDAFLLFPNAKPFTEYGGLYLPLRDFLAVAGVEAKITYDAATGVAEVIVEGFEPEIFSLEDGAQMRDGVFYVEEYQLSFFLSWDYNYDYSNEILYLVDRESLVEKLNEGFGICNHLFQSLLQTTYPVTTQQVEGAVTAAVTFYGDKEDDTASASVTFNGLIQDGAMELAFATKADVAQIKDTLLSLVDEEDWQKINALSAGQGKLIINSMLEEMYIQSNLLSVFMPGLKERDWLASYFPAMDPENLAGFAQMDIGSLIYQNVSNSYYTDDIYGTALEWADFCRALFGDSRFKVEKNATGITYTLKATNQDLQKAMQGRKALRHEYDFFGYSFLDAKDFGLELSFREQDNSITEMRLSTQATIGSFMPVSYNIKMDRTPQKTEGSFSMVARYLGKADFKWWQTMKPSTEVPAASPPEGDNIVRNDDIMYDPYY